MQSFCSKKKKQRKLKVTLVDEVTDHLDLRTIMRSQLDLNLLIKQILSKEQLILFNHQRQRVASVTSKRLKMSKSDSESQEDVFGIKRLPSRSKLIKLLETYEPTTVLDRRLLSGLLLRDKDK